MCEGSGCETKENILEWIKGKYIILLYYKLDRVIWNENIRYSHISVRRKFARLRE